ncbi:TetR/AcrR family transcriptional regulator [Labrys monachus]|uniref:AcrR family transcriptional regulator n=1 Tax=Labrys monachus TaxID=217067 RepID=A0ABU0FJY7_9HYPH|nr:TetR/AcrR family transcriptional regulator [Labrys monachus]MDQ0394928.1 AcrR family transcriptional regulator [Labrys monachus]
MPAGREALLAAARRAFASQGFDAADVRSIAAEANVSPNLVRVHFGNKAALWEACLDAIVSESRPVMEAIRRIATDPSRALAERLRETILRGGEFYAAHPDVRDFVTRSSTDMPERAERLNTLLLTPAYESSRELFAAGIEAGIIRSSHPALFFALVTAALNQPPAFPALLNRLAPEIDIASARDRMIETVVATLLHLSPVDPSDQPQQRSRA